MALSLKLKHQNLLIEGLLHHGDHSKCKIINVTNKGEPLEMSEIKNLKTFMNHGIPEIDVDEVHEHAPSLTLIDVRRPEEYNNELGHVANAKLFTLGPSLEHFLHSVKNPEEYIVFICHSGGRSSNATAMARELGLKNTFNMTGGMLRWNSFNLPTIKD